MSGGGRGGGGGRGTEHLKLIFGAWIYWSGEDKMEKGLYHFLQPKVVLYPRKITTQK
jgi:hypothetical protein